MELIPQADTKFSFKDSSCYFIHFCPECHRIPSIKLNEKDTALVDITCDCCDNYPISVQLHDYIKENLKKKKPIYCSIPEVHDKPTKAEVYCTQCNIWLCLECLNQHRKVIGNHITIKSNGLILPSHCEAEKCRNKDRIESYCHTCEINICESCYYSHQMMGHTVVFLKEMVNENHINQLNEQLIRLEEILVFYKSLLYSYNSTMEIPNYNARNNILINNFRRTINSFLLELEQNKKAEKEKENETQEKEITTKEPLINLDEYTSFISADYNISKIDSPDSLRILGKYFTLLNEENAALMIDDKLVGYKKEFTNDIDMGYHKVKIMVKDNVRVNNMKNMFAHCSSLIRVNFSNLRVSNLVDTSSLFANCTSLSTVINLDKYNTSKVKDMSLMLYNCSNLSNASFVSSFNTKEVTNMKCFFEGCSSLKDLQGISNFDTSKTVNMSNMFCKCASLTSLNVETFNTENVEDMRNMFAECYMLESIQGLESFATYHVKDMSGMFCKCSSLVELDLSSFNTTNVLHLRNMFDSCSKLSKINMKNFNLSRVYSISCMFYECYFLETIDLENFVSGKTKERQDVFYRCKRLAKETVGKFLGEQ